MLSLFDSKLLDGVEAPARKEKEPVLKIILKYKKFPLKYTKSKNLTKKNNPELYDFCVKIPTNMTGEGNGYKTWENRLNNKQKEGGSPKSPMTQCEAVNLFIKLTQGGVTKTEQDLFSEICDFLDALNLQKKCRNQYSSDDSWIEACSLLQKRYSLFDSDLQEEDYCPKISKMAQLSGVKKASGIYLRYVDDICAVATIFACEDISFYNLLKDDMNKTINEAIKQKSAYIKNTLKEDKNYMTDVRYNAINMTVTEEVSRDVLYIIETYRNVKQSLKEELIGYAARSVSLTEGDEWHDNPLLLGSGIRRTQLKQLCLRFPDLEEEIEKREFLSEELIEKISGAISEKIMGTDKLDEIADDKISQIFNKFDFEKDEKLIKKIDDEEISSFIRNVLILCEAEAYIPTISRGKGNAETFKDKVNQVLYKYGLCDLQETDSENFYIDWYVYNALAGYERLLKTEKEANC